MQRYPPNRQRTGETRHETILWKHFQYRNRSLRVNPSGFTHIYGMKQKQERLSGPNGSFDSDEI